MKKKFNKELNKSLTKELDKMYNIYLFYKQVLETSDYNNDNTYDHIRNIRHYLDLLEERIDDFNEYNILNNLPVCKEQIDRDNQVKKNKQNFMEFYLLQYLKKNI